MSYAQYPSPQHAGEGGGYGNANQMFYQDQNKRPQNHTRSKSSFSFRSSKSDKSSSSKGKVDLTETEEQKRRHQFAPTALSNPNRAISEAQPAVRAQQEQATLQPLREVEHKDWQTGAVITDPDASNPSRSRFERPLDTIRSFEAAADHGFMQRNPPTRSESHDGMMTGYSTRRSSVVGGPDGTPNPRYAQPYGYESRRPSMVRQNYDYGRGPPSSYPRRGMGPRMSSAPTYSRPQYDYQGPYNNYNYRGSHDTVHTGESSGSLSEPWANSTDPSSENSSIDKIHASKQNDQNGDAYGGNYGRRSASPFRMPIAEETWQDQRNYQGVQNNDYYYQNGGPGQYYPPQQQQQRLPNGSMRNPHPQRVPQSEPSHNAASAPGTRSSFSKQQEYWQNQQQPKQLPQAPPKPPMQPMQVDPRQGKLSKQRLDKPTPAAPTEKKKSWLKRTFSKA